MQIAAVYPGKPDRMHAVAIRRDAELNPRDAGATYSVRKFRSHFLCALASLRLCGE